MGKASVILVVAFVVMGTYHAIGMQRNTFEANERVSESQYEMMARNAALAGYQRARNMLAEDFSTPADKNFSAEYDGATYEVGIATDGGTNSILGGDLLLDDAGSNQAEVISVGKVQGPGGKEIRYHVKAIFERKVDFPDEVQEYMNYAMLSGGDLTLDGNTDTGVYATGDSSNQLNANLHTNEDLTVNGGAAEVDGFGTYVNSASGKLDAFEPNYNPNDADPVQQVNPVDIPAVDPDEIDARIDSFHTVERYSGTMKLDKSDAKLENFSTYPGTREDPFILHIEADGTDPGDLQVVGNVAVEGYAMFIVDGMFDMSSNSSTMKASLSDSYDGPDESSIAVYADNGMDLSGGAEVWAQILIDGSITSNTGTPEIYGSMTSSGYTKLGGSPTISYRPASVALSIQGRSKQIKLMTYNEW